jgi:hypothetical protein
MSWLAEVEELLKELKVAKHVYDLYGGPVHVCIDCGRWVPEEEWLKGEHDNHLYTFTNCDHDGVGEWLRCLNWLLKRVKA